MRYRRWLVEGLILLGLLLALGLWQGRHLASGAAPALEAQTLDGTPFALGALREPVLVYFWADWCPVCRLTGPNVAALARDHRVITVAMQSGDGAAVAAHLAEHDLALPVIVDTTGTHAARWGVRAVPATFFVDGSGTIRFTTVGYTSTLGLRLRLWATTLLSP